MKQCSMKRTVLCPRVKTIPRDRSATFQGLSPPPPQGATTATAVYKMVRPGGQQFLMLCSMQVDSAGILVYQVLRVCVSWLTQ